MRQSYCGLCNDCQLGNPNFLETVSRLKEYVDRFRANWWVHCFPQEEAFSFPEFRKAMDWFLANRECPGCQCGRGVEDCPIRVCAQERKIEQCYQCPDLEPCNNFEYLLAEFPDVKTKLRRRQLKWRARLYHQRLETQKNTG